LALASRRRLSPKERPLRDTSKDTAAVAIAREAGLLLLVALGTEGVEDGERLDVALPEGVSDGEADSDADAERDDVAVVVAVTDPELDTVADMLVVMDADPLALLLDVGDMLLVPDAVADVVCNQRSTGEGARSYTGLSDQRSRAHTRRSSAR
jgi:hypothetical protein